MRSKTTGSHITWPRHQFSSSFISFLSDNKRSSSWLYTCLFSRRCMAYPRYFVDVCQLVTAAGRRQLRSSDAATCVSNVTYHSAIVRLRWLGHHCGIAPFRPILGSSICLSDNFARCWKYICHIHWVTGAYSEFCSCTLTTNALIGLIMEK